ncbi:hypothetical protein N7486_008248 [Penicillium sp. IBT 16267x]|nr:hypothetical protein N7486_008248 [Penicillium sp. IBT 16267x]
MQGKCRECVTMEQHNGMDQPQVTTSSGQAPVSTKMHLALPTWATWGIAHSDINKDWIASSNTSQMTLDNVRLDDQGLFWALATMGSKERAKRFSADFDSHGNPRTFRDPKDPPMVIWAHGLPWFPVFKEVYILAGSWATATGYLIHTYPSSYLLL